MHQNLRANLIGMEMFVIVSINDLHK
jgi:hypothetical protein